MLHSYTKQSYLDGLGELLYGGEGDGVLPWLSKPAEVTRELLRNNRQNPAVRVWKPALLSLPWVPATSPAESRSLGDCHAAHVLSSIQVPRADDQTENGHHQAGELSLKQKVNRATSCLPSTRTQKPLTHTTLQWLSDFSCIGGLTHCTSGCLGLVSLLQPQQLNHLRNKEVHKQINTR